MAWSKTELLREKAWRACRGSSPLDVDALVLFMERYCHIQHPEQGMILIPLRPAQLAILDTWMNERYSIVLKARQIGWSTLVALYSLWLAFFWPDKLIIMLSKGDREAMKLLQKSTYAYEHLPAWMKLRGPRRTTKNLKKITFDNASVIESLPSKEDPARSSTASLVIVDEWAFLDNPEEAWASIEPIADVGGRVIGLSTANGWGNFFHTMWVKAKTGASQFKPMFFPWSANDDRDEAWLQAKFDNAPQQWLVHQEYPTTEDEAFIKSGNPVFDVEALGLMETMRPGRGHLTVMPEKPRSPLWTPSSKGPIRIFEQPRLGESYVIGGDVAQGLEHGDFSSAHVISAATDHVAAVWHGHIDPDLFGDALCALGYFFNTALVAVEVNNHGLTTLKAMQRAGYPRLFFRRDVDKRYEQQGPQLGWYTSMVTKPLMIDELAMALRAELIVQDEETIAELRTYVRDEKGQMSGSPYDDRVISLAIANQMRRWHTSHEFAEPEVQAGTWDYYFQKVMREKEQTDRLVIGVHNVREFV